MEELKLHQRARAVYQDINNKWLLLHFRLLAICSLVSVVLEVLTFFVIRASNLLTYSVNEYWLKFIITPACILSFLTLLGYVFLKNKKISILLKRFAISFLFGLLAFVLSLVHSGFISVLVAAAFPVLMTIIYENQKLTAVIAGLGAGSQVISGFSLFWDPEKALDSSYLINLMILVITTLCVWFICASMIKFMKMKREIIILNDIERHQLRVKVNIDGLTGVGNKLALMRQLEEAPTLENKICYLAMMDIDDFKLINDTYGHILGDDVLKYVGDGMREMQAKSNAFRYGGDEFCILFSEPSIENVKRELAGIQDYLNLKMKQSGFDDTISISIGIAAYSPQKTPLELLQQADNALYESKRKQSAQITIFQKENN